MSFRIHCPECDIMFEPPAGVWAAQCPFCGKLVEVPQVRAGSTSTEFRKRVRKGPGWWPRLRAHLPAWTNLVLATSFVMLLTSALIQAWLAAHEQRSSDAFLRAMVSWKKAQADKDDAETVKAADRLIEILKSEPARELAAAQGLKESEVASMRRKAARANWERRLEGATKKPPDEAFADLSDLFRLAKADADSIDLAPKSVEAWARIRADTIRAAMSQFAAAFDKGESRSAWNSLKSAEGFLGRKFDDGSGSDPFRVEIGRAVDRIAGRFGLTFGFRMKARTFVSENDAKDRVLPLLEDRLGKLGYIVNDLKDPEYVKRFDDSAKYRMDVEVAEKYGRAFEDTPHRTTSIEFDFVLKSPGMADERRNVVVRTPRIPAKTAIGMSRLQLAKNSDERIERNLQQAAW
ncbi:hypothetical protein GC170_21675, partial [bacterium]|nr:hypothetical protein [bacterium]